jgi:hypothetical protein
MDKKGQTDLLVPALFLNFRVEVFEIVLSPWINNDFAY